MSLGKISDAQLLLDLESLFQQERANSRNILLHLKEIRLRRLYAKRGYASLAEMLIKYFRQSEPAARQRIKALELMLDVPVVEERLVSGELNLSTVAMAQRKILEQEKIVGRSLSSDKKAEIVDSITGKTLDQTEVELFKLLPETATSPKTFERRVSADATRLSVTLPNDVHEQMNRLREIWAHIDPHMDPVEIMRRAFNITLDKVDPVRRKGKISEVKSKLEGSKNRMFVEAARTSTTGKVTSSSNATAVTSKKTLTQVPADSAGTCVSELAREIEMRSAPSNKRITYYGKEFDRLLWQRAGAQCEFVDPQTKKRCDGRTLLQREHVIPIALGGTNELSNLQLLCRTHNLLRARQVFGDKKIDRHQRR